MSELDDIQRRADNATPGPWNRFDAQISHTQIDGYVDPVGRRKAQEQTEHDIQFVMHARTDVPALLAIARTQQASLDAVLELANESGRRGWHVSPAAIRAALEPTT